MTRYSPVLYPPFNIVRFSHVEYGVSDLEASKEFYVGSLGLVASHEDEDRICLRAMEERGHHSIVLSKSNETTVKLLGFKVFDDADLDKLSNFFREEDLPAEWVDRPFQGRTLRARDPFGVPIEFYAEMNRLPAIHQRYDLYKGVKPLRIDHANMFSPDVDKSVAFYTRLGFRLTEYTEDEETGRCWAAWMHRKGNVHDIAMTNGLGPRLHHSAFWVSTPLNIIDLLDLLAAKGRISCIERGPGRHGISNAFFLYLRDPDGNRIEIYSSDYQTVDPDHEPIKWDLKDPQRQTLWGAPAPRSWFEEGTCFDGADTSEPVNAGVPIIAP